VFDTGTPPDSFPHGTSTAVINGDTGAPDSTNQGILKTERYVTLGGYRKFVVQTYFPAQNEATSLWWNYFRKANDGANTWSNWIKVAALPDGGDLNVLSAGKGVILTNAAGNINRRVRLNDTGDGLVFEAP
jgi:hypothetical protein